MSKIKIFDTTLRDGEQSPGCSMNLKEKLEVAKCLERLKVDVIEAGFASPSPGDFESVQSIARAVKECSVASLARATEKDIDCAWEAVKDAADPRIHVVHRHLAAAHEYKLKMKPEAVLERGGGDGRLREEVLARTSSSPPRTPPAATSTSSSGSSTRRSAAARRSSTCRDTVGYTTPDEMRALIATVIARVPDADKVEFSVHCHNDLGMATANSLAGVLGGARQIECTINGLGERAGNTLARGGRHGDAHPPGPVRRARHRHRDHADLPAPARRCTTSSVSPCRSTSPSSGATPSCTSPASTSTAC